MSREDINFEEKKKILEIEKELEEYRHKNRLIEIEEELKAKKEIERMRFDGQMALHRLRRRDIMNTIETKRAYHQELNQKPK